MKNFLSIVIAALFFASCTKDDSNPLSPGDITGLDIAIKLKEWSNIQPEKFVVCVFGDTTNGKLYNVGDLVTNLEFNTSTFKWVFKDCLFIDTAMAVGMEYKFSSAKLKTAYDSLSLTENQIKILLYDLGFKLRMMDFDSLTNNLNIKLIDWSKHQFPPKIIWTGFSYYCI